MNSAMRKARLHAVTDDWPDGLVVGWIVAVAPDGRASVEFPGNHRGALVARSTVRIKGEELPIEKGRLDVMLAFPVGEPGPVIVGIVTDLLVEPASGNGGAPLEARVDGKHVQIHASERIEIRCGEGSIALSADGRIVIKGRELVSRAAQNNKIRGASVLIN